MSVVSDVPPLAPTPSPIPNAVTNKLSVPSSINVSRRDLYLASSFVETGKMADFNSLFGVDVADVFDSNCLRRLETKLASMINASFLPNAAVDSKQKSIRVLIEPMLRLRVDERSGSRSTNGPLMLTSDQIDVADTDPDQQILVCFLEIDVSFEALIAYRQRFCNMPIDAVLGRGLCLFFTDNELTKPLTTAELDKLPPARREIYFRLRLQFFSASAPLFRLVHAKYPVTLEMGLYDVERISGLSTAAQASSANGEAVKGKKGKTAKAKKQKKKKAKKERVDDDDDDDDGDSDADIDEDDDEDSDEALVGSKKQVPVKKGKVKRARAAGSAVSSTASASIPAVNQVVPNMDHNLMGLAKPPKVTEIVATPLDPEAGEKTIRAEEASMREWYLCCLRNNSFYTTLTMRGFMRAENVLKALTVQPCDFGREFFVASSDSMTRRPKFPASTQTMMNRSGSEAVFLNNAVVLNQSSIIHKTGSTELDELSCTGFAPVTTTPFTPRGRTGPEINKYASSTNSRQMAPETSLYASIFDRHLLDLLDLLDLARLSLDELIKATRHRLTVLKSVSDFYEYEEAGTNHLYVRSYPEGYDSPYQFGFQGAPGLLGRIKAVDYAAIALATICVIVKGDDELVDWFLRAERFMIAARNEITDPLHHLSRIKRQIDKSGCVSDATPLGQIILTLRAELIEDLFEVDDGIWAPVDEDQEENDLVSNQCTYRPPIDSEDMISLMGEDEDFSEQIRLEESLIDDSQKPEST
jgi:hypothetical protein